MAQQTVLDMELEEFRKYRPNPGPIRRDTDDLGFSIIRLIAEMISRDPLFEQLDWGMSGPDTDEVYFTIYLPEHRDREYMIRLSTEPVDEEEQQARLEDEEE